jgi:hypothetical protein
LFYLKSKGKIMFVLSEMPSVDICLSMQVIIHLNPL